METIHYLSIIRKADFIDLFKYGHRYIFDYTEFDGNLNAHADDQELFDRITCNMNLFEYSFEYLMIHYISEKQTAHSVELKYVQGVYTFNEEAKKEMSISFNPRIQLHVSQWATKFEQLQQKLFIKQSMRGVDNLWAIFDLPKEDRAKCEAIITDDIVSEVFRQLYTDERPKGEQSLWIYLLRYERHSFYPKNLKGIFCDLIHVVCNLTVKEEKQGETIEGTDLYHLLMKCPEDKFNSLSEIVEKSPLTSMTQKLTGCRFAIAAPLFLYLKSRFRDGVNQKPDKEIIDHSKEFGGFECSVAIYLLGITLGYDKTYDGLYDVVEFPILKKKITTQQTIADVVTIPSKINDKVEDATSKAGFPEESGSSSSQVDDTAEHVEKQDLELDKEMEPLCTAPNDIETSAKSQPQPIQVELFQDENVETPLAWMKLRTGVIKPAFTNEEVECLKSKKYKILDEPNEEDKKLIRSKGYTI